MPQRRKPARIWQRPDTGQWVILDGRTQTRLPFAGDGQRGQAEKALADYISQKELAPRSKPGSREDVSVGEVLIRYLEERGPHVADPERLYFAVKALTPYWANEPVSSVKAASCRAYARHRGVGDGTIRRELGALRAALTHAEREGYLESAPLVALPPPPPPRDRWLRREEVDALLAYAPPHVQRFIHIAIYTGTRAKAVTRLRWLESVDTGWIDADNGILYRAGASERKTKKRRGSCKLPATLLEMCREWRQDGSPYVIHIDGRPIKSIRKAFNGAVRRARLEGVTRHTLKHTAVTWAMQRGMALDRAAEYFATSPEMLRRVYQQHHPEFTADAARIMDGG